MNFVLSQVFGGLGALFNVTGMFFRNKLMILLFIVVACICFSISNFLLGGISGGVISLIQAIITTINYFYEKKGIKYPDYLIILYLFIAFLCGLFTYNSLLDVLPIVCLLFFILSILQTKELYLKVCMLFMFLFFALYAFFINGFILVFINVFQSFMTLIAIFKIYLKSFSS